MKRFYFILAVAFLVASSLSLVQLFKRIPRAIARVTAHIRGDVSFVNSYFNGAEYLSSRYVGSSQLLWVFLPEAPNYETVYKSLRQIVRWNRMLSETYFLEDIDCAKGGFLLIERSQCGQNLSIEKKFPYVVAESGPWKLFAAEGAKVCNNCQKGDVNVMAREFTITIVFVLFLIWLFLTRGGTCVLFFVLAVSLVTFFFALGCILNCCWGRTLLCACCLAEALLVVKWFAKKKFSMTVMEWVMVIGIVCVLVLISLSHHLSTPNFAGNVGGKAKLLYLTGGFSTEFWRGIGVSEDMNPAYPPAYAMLVLCLSVFMGDPCVWFVQLFGTIFFALLGFELVSLAQTKASRFVVLLYLIGPTSILVSGSFYSEPGMVFCILMGLKLLLMSSECVYGALLLGFASWFKVEGVLFALIAYGLFVFVSGCRRLSLRQNFIYGLIIIVPTVIWWCFINIVDAHFDGFDPLHFKFSRLLSVWAEMVRLQMKYPFEVLGPLLACLCLAEHLSLFAWLFYTMMVFLVASLGFSCVYAFFPMSSMRWMVETNAPRLFWSLGVILLGYVFILDLIKRDSNSIYEKSIGVCQKNT